MIYVYGPNETDFTTLGLVGALTPSQCTYTEGANGESKIEMLHPIDEAGKYASLEIDCILRVPVPVRNPPAIVEGNTTVTTLTHWEVKADGGGQTAANRKLYADKGLTKALRYIPVGREVEMIWQNGNVSKIIYGGHEVYCESGILTKLEVPDTVIPNAAYGIEQAASSYTVRDQLFRIKSVTADLNGISVYAWHVFYDLAGNVTDVHDQYDTTAGAALNQILSNCKAPHIFSGYTDSAESRAELDWDMISPVKAMLDPEDGFAAKYNLQLMRDNFDIYFVGNAGFDRGVWIEYGKNMTSVRRSVDSTSVVTRVIPIGQDKDGNDMTLPGDTPWIDSDNIDDFPEPHIYVLRCSSACKVGSTKEGGGKVTLEEARANMQQEAQDLLDTGVYALTSSLDVDFVAMGDDPRYASYRQLENVFLWDTVHIKATHLFPTQALQISYVDWDVLNMRYNSVRLGVLDDNQASVNTWDLPQGISGYKILSGSIGSNALGNGVLTTRMLTVGMITADSAAIADAAIVRANIANAAIGSAQIDSAAVTYAKIARAAVTQLSADALAAVQARVRELVAGSITTDQLYADLAAIAVAQLTTANIGRANIDWAAINTLSACIAQIASAEIGTAKIDYAKIVDSVTDTAIISQGEAGKLFIARLAVTDANMVSLTAGELLLKAADGSFVRLMADGQGGVTSQTVQVEGDNIAQATIPGGKLIENSITARELNVSSIFADQALIRAIKAANIDVADLFAAQATIDKLDSWIVSANTIQALQGQLNLWAEEKIESRVSGKADAATAVASVQVQYAQSSSAAVAPASGWSATAPPWEEGKVMWQRTVTTYADSHSETSAPTCLSGATGAAGEDATVLRIDSSRGTVFKNNQVATVLSAVIYHGSERVDTIAALHRVYGSGAYLQWSWQRMDEERYGVISADDSRIGQDGFTLTLSPADVDVKVSFMCELITD